MLICKTNDSDDSKSCEKKDEYFNQFYWSTRFNIRHLSVSMFHDFILSVNSTFACNCTSKPMTESSPSQQVWQTEEIIWLQPHNQLHILNSWINMLLEQLLQKSAHLSEPKEKCVCCEMLQNTISTRPYFALNATTHSHIHTNTLTHHAGSICVLDE